MHQRVLSKLEAHGVNGPAKEWVCKALDPACEASATGLPDASAYSVLRPEYRVSQTINAPTIGGASSWDLMLWSMPGDVNGTYWAAAASPADFSLPAAPASGVTGYIQLQAPTDVPGTTIWNQQASGGLAPVTYDYGTRVASNFPYAFRHMYKGLTIDLVAAAVADQGSIYAAQFQPVMQTAFMLDTLIDQGLGGPGIAVKECGFRLPLNEDQLTRMSVGFYEGDARDGAYLPLRLCGPSQPFVSAFSGASPSVLRTARPPTPGTYSPLSDISTVPFSSMAVPAPLAWSGYGVEAGGAVVLPWIYSAAQNATAMGFGGSGQGFDTGYDNMNVGVVFMRGLTAPNGGGFGAAVRVVVRAGFEVVPSPVSPDRIFAEPAAPYHPRALESYYAICLELKDAYPSSYNSLGDIFDVIEKIATGIWKPVRAIGETVASVAGLGGVRKKPVTPKQKAVTYKPPSKTAQKPSIGGLRVLAQQKRVRRSKKTK